MFHGHHRGLHLGSQRSMASQLFRLPGKFSIPWIELIYQMMKVSHREIERPPWFSLSVFLLLLLTFSYLLTGFLVEGLSNFAQRRIFLHGRLAPRLRQVYGRQFRCRRRWRQPMKPLLTIKTTKWFKKNAKKRQKQTRRFSSSLLHFYLLSLSPVFATL